MANIFILAKGLSMGAGVPVTPSFLNYRGTVNHDPVLRGRVNHDSVVVGRVNTDPIQRGAVKAR